MKVLTSIILSIAVFFISLKFPYLIPEYNILFRPVIILIFFLTLFYGEIYGIILGFFLGLLSGVFYNLPMGIYPLLYVSLAFLFSLVGKKIYKRGNFSIFILFLAIFFVGVIQIISEVNNIAEIFIKIFSHIFPESLINAAIGFLILVVIRKLE